MDPVGAKNDLHVALQRARTCEDIIGLYRRAWAHADATIVALALDAEGRVPHWPRERATVTLHQVLVHLVAETNRHAGHADVLRELIDGAAGLRVDNDNLPASDEVWWAEHHARVERAARAAAAGARLAGSDT